MAVRVEIPVQDAVVVGVRGAVRGDAVRCDAIRGNVGPGGAVRCDAGRRSAGLMELRLFYVNIMI